MCGKTYICYECKTRKELKICITKSKSILVRVVRTASKRVVSRSKNL